MMPLIALDARIFSLRHRPVAWRDALNDGNAKDRSADLTVSLDGEASGGAELRMTQNAAQYATIEAI